MKAIQVLESLDLSNHSKSIFGDGVLVGLKKTLPNAKAQTALAGSSQLSCNAHAICLTAKKLGGMVLHCTLAFLRGLKSKFLQLPGAVETMLVLRLTMRCLR